MKISVVIPLYNSEKTIISTLESIRKQTKLSSVYEIIVVNDGSTDDSLNIVKKYKEEQSSLPLIIVDKKNGGVSSARNVGMQMAKGNWLSLLDSDDEWLPNKLEVQIKTINENPNIDCLGGPFNNTDLKILFKKIDRLYKADIKDICIKNFPQPSTVIFKREIFDVLGGFDESQRYAEDGNYFMQVCYYYNLYYLPELLIIYDGGKTGFGESGLSANLSKMYEGNVKNITDIFNKKQISFSFFCFLRLFYFLKYIRRLILTKFRKIKKRQLESENHE